MVERAESAAASGAGQDVPGAAGGRRGRVLAALAVVLAGVMAFHRGVPNAVGRVGSLVESFLPWVGVLIVALFVVALVRRSAVALVAVLLPVGVWVHLFGGLLLPAAENGGRELVVVHHNLSDHNRHRPPTPPAGLAAHAPLGAL
ncbi:endonuclease/exonuclease/phosphatase family protein, partial [Streptomyces anulatus]